MSALAWQDDAACAGRDPEPWFGDRGKGAKDAVRVCLGCPVRNECLEFHLEHERKTKIAVGVAGGMSARARLRLVEVT